MTDSEVLQLLLAELRDVKAQTLRIEEKLSWFMNEMIANTYRNVEDRLSLSRDLCEIVRNSAECELLTIKVNHLETEMRNLKRQIS